jgi:hypothetical protein
MLTAPIPNATKLSLGLVLGIRKKGLAMNTLYLLKHIEIF